MTNDNSSRRAKTYRRLGAIRHLGMGLFLVVIGIIVIYIKRFGTIDLSPIVAIALGILVVAYGLFRIWRGWQDINDKD